MTDNANNTYDVLIIGGGPAGATAAIYTARAGLKTGVLDKGITTGALGITSKIANFPGVDGDISGAELLRVMRRQAIGFGAEFINDKAVGTDLSADLKTVFGNFNFYQARAIIIATGSMGRANLLKGETEFLGRGVSYCGVCDAAFYKDKQVAVIGKTDEALEEALYLSRFASKVHLLVPGKQIEASDSLCEELRQNEKIELYTNTRVQEIVGDEKVSGLLWSPIGASEGSNALDVDGVFVYLQGGKPITDFLAGQLEPGEKGCLQVDRDMQTLIPGVYAVGDVLCTQVRQAVIAVGDGAIAAIAVEKWLRGKSTARQDWH
jgi:thioredoxin reductase (NADPH)